MYHLYRYFQADGTLSLGILNTNGYPSSEEDHYLKFNKVNVYVPGRKDNTAIIKAFNILTVPAPKPAYSVTYAGKVKDPIINVSLQILATYILSLPLTTDLSKIDITTIYPELFI